jgi:hypothetical protein
MKRLQNLTYPYLTQAISHPPPNSENCLNQHSFVGPSPFMAFVLVKCRCFGHFVDFSLLNTLLPLPFAETKNL